MLLPRRVLRKGFLITFEEYDNIEDDTLHIRGHIHGITEVDIGQLAKHTRFRSLDQMISKTVLADFRGSALQVIDDKRAQMGFELMKNAPTGSYITGCSLLETRRADELVEIDRERKKLRAWEKRWGLG